MSARRCSLGQTSCPCYGAAVPNHITGTRRDLSGIGLTDEVLRRIVVLGKHSYYLVGNVLRWDCRRADVAMPSMARLTERTGTNAWQERCRWQVRRVPGDLARGLFDTLGGHLATTAAVKSINVGVDYDGIRWRVECERTATGRLMGHSNIVTILDSGFCPTPAAGQSDVYSRLSGLSSQPGETGQVVGAWPETPMGLEPA